MHFEKNIPTNMLAPCGVNCTVCYVYLKKKKPCQGCRGQEESQPDHCRACSIRNCISQRGIQFCFECPSFPCTVIKRLDKSYQQRYQVSLIKNAMCIQATGAEQFLLEEKQRWTCAVCGGVISLHDRLCSECGRQL